MNYNASTKFPEYYSNSNDDMYPDTEANWVGWVLWKNNITLKTRT
jgi:hypothetical protein